MPIAFLTEAQVAALRAVRWALHAWAPTRVQLERCFFLDDADRQWVDRRRPGPRPVLLLLAGGRGGGRV
jgi:hypothetical protein